MNIFEEKPLWQAEFAEQTNMALFAKGLGFENDMEGLQKYSIETPEKFWASLWDFIGVEGEKGAKTFEKALHPIDVKFFSKAKLNYAQNLLNSKDEAIAIIAYDEGGNRVELNFGQLRNLVAKTAAALSSSGVKRGDIVAGIVPNCIEAIVAHLGAATIGAIWSSCSPDFGAQAIIDRLGQIEPKILFCANGYVYGGKRFSLAEKITAVLKEINSIEKTVMFEFSGGEEDLLESDLLNNAQTIWFENFLIGFEEAEFIPEQLPFDHPLVILFSSGTTGKPKCLIHRAGGLLLNHKKEQQLHCDIKVGDRLLYFTTCGWMMWNWQLSALASGSTLVLFDGNPFFPNPIRLYEIVAQEKVTHFGTSARYIDACLKEGLNPKKILDLSSLRAVFSTGSPLVASGFAWVYENLGDVHLASISGGTDICACFVGGWPNKPVYSGQIQGSMLGLDVDVIDENGISIIDEAGELICKNAHPSMPLGFFNDEDNLRYKQAYFSRFDNIWAQGDWAIKRKTGGFEILGRSDATLNPGGVRIGTAEIYRQLANVNEVAESVAVGKNIEADVEVWLFVKLAKNAILNKELEKRIKKSIREGASPRHVPKRIICVPDIPITRSGKISEIAVRDVLHGRELKNVNALANPQSLEYFKDLD